MNRALKWKLIAGFVLVFLAGGATGVFVSATTAHHFFLGPPQQRGQVAKAMKNRLEWQLRLTEEQMTKISPIIDKTGAQLEEIRGDTGRRVREALVQTHKEISQYLTPEQKVRLQQVEERHRRWMQHRGPWRGRNNSPASPAAEASPE
jgi:Spy/CpxP family protein refolding chaperone